MRMVDRHAKYLGLPTVLGGAKKTTFAAIKDRVWSKLGGWKEKLLSCAGKEILLKAVVQAIPTYIMSVYKLPITLIDHLHSSAARFWWGGDESKRKVHWKSWEALCEPKWAGGMGFMDLKVFNDALLAKQIWRLVSCEDSLCGRVLKAKYFAKSGILDAHLGDKPSYCWRSIWSSKALFKEGMMWRVGNGSSIRIWKDPWLVNDDSRFIKSLPPAGREEDTVLFLIDPTLGEWNMREVQQLFLETEVKAILAIPLSMRRPKDSIRWAFSKDGAYSVKAAYMLGMSLVLDNLHDCWPVIWDANVIPKAQHFLWKTAANILPTRDPFCTPAI